MVVLCSPRVVSAGDAGVRVAASVVASGGVVVYPTDTVYGVGGWPLWEYVVWRVLRAKERPPSRPVPILVGSIEDAERVAEVSDEARVLMERFWPGPLTLVLPARPVVPRVVHAGTGWVGVRMPGHEAALKLVRMAGGLLVGTSANRHRQPPPRRVVEALRQLGCRVDLYVDGGVTPGGVPSTVVRVEAGGRIELIRRGPIGLEEIMRALKAGR
jgi:L-threonylcarbamoyladenylate synthase